MEFYIRLQLVHAFLQVSQRQLHLLHHVVHVLQVKGFVSQLCGDKLDRRVASYLLSQSSQVSDEISQVYFSYFILKDVGELGKVHVGYSGPGQLLQIPGGLRSEQLDT